MEAAAIPPTYFPHRLSLDSYARLWTYQAGLPTYLFNSAGTALLTILFCLALTIPAGYALARFPVPGKEAIFAVLLLALIIPYQALFTPLFFMFAKLHLTNTLIGLAIVHTAIQLPFSVYVMRNSFEAVPRELEEAAVIDGCNSWQALIRIYLPAIRPAIVTVALFAFITSWNEFLAALVIMNSGATFTLPLVLASARAGDQHRRHGLGHAAGGHHDLDHPLRALLPAPAEILRLGLPERRGEVSDDALRRRRPHRPPRPVQPRRQPATIHDVARLSNVSIGTVSKALNNRGSLRAETRAKVIAVAKELAFRPNDLAQSLHRGQSLTVGLITTDSFGRFSIPIMDGLEERLADSRISVFMCNAPMIPSASDGMSNRCSASASTASWSPAAAPTLGAGCDVDGAAAPGPLRLLAVRRSWLALPRSRRRRRSGPCDRAPDRARTAAHRACHRAGAVRGRACCGGTGIERRSPRPAIADRRDFCVTGVWSEEWGRQAVERLFRTKKSAPDAIFCGNDQIARGVVDALRERGIVVPDDVSLVGFDNWTIVAEATRPPLTTST